MRVVAFLISINRRSLLDGSRVSANMRTCNFCMLRPLLTAFKPSQALFSKCYSSFKSDEAKSNEPPKKKNQSPKILVTDLNGKKTAMYLGEAEKFAKHNNLNLVEMENSKNEKPKYKFVKVSEVFQDKSKGEGTITKKKKFMVKDVITEHDFKIKINSMLKYIEKGLTVVCVIDVVDPKGKLDEKLTIINNSKIKDYLVQNVQSSKRLTLYFEKKVSETDKSEDQIKEADESS